MLLKVQKAIMKELKENTRRTELLSMIKKEKYELEDLIKSQDDRKKYFDKLQKNHQRFMEDLQKLEDIICEQELQIQELKDEILVLKTKGLPPGQPVSKKPKSPKKKTNEEKEEIKAWDEFGEYIVVKDEDLEKEANFEEMLRSSNSMGQL